MLTVKDPVAVLGSIGLHLMICALIAAQFRWGDSLRAAGERASEVFATEISDWTSSARTRRQTKTKEVVETSPLDLQDARAKKEATEQASAEPQLQAVPNAPVTGRAGHGAGGTSTDYRAVLHSYLDSYKTYPKALKELGISGTVLVHFRVTRTGTLEDISIPAQDIPGPLRAEALRFLRRMERVPAPPADFSDEQLIFELPLRYEASRAHS